jgi:hypothetical protein
VLLRRFDTASRRRGGGDGLALRCARASLGDVLQHVHSPVLGQGGLDIPFCSFDAQEGSRRGTTISSTTAANATANKTKSRNMTNAAFTTRAAIRTANTIGRSTMTTTHPIRPNRTPHTRVRTAPGSEAPSAGAASSNGCHAAKWSARRRALAVCVLECSDSSTSLLQRQDCGCASSLSLPLRPHPTSSRARLQTWIETVYAVVTLLRAGLSGALSFIGLVVRRAIDSLPRPTAAHLAGSAGIKTAGRGQTQRAVGLTMRRV